MTVRAAGGEGETGNLDPRATAVPQDRIDALAAASPELRQILDELRGDGLREPIGPDPLLSPTLSNGMLDEFLSLAVRECVDGNLFGLALALPMCAFQRGAGYEALEYCLKRRNLPPDHREFVAGRMLGAKSVVDVVWAHGIVLSAGNTGIYHSFLGRHAAVVVDRCFDQLAAYLLDPARGPGGYTAACIEIVLKHDVGAPWPFVRRWLEWLDTGLFDGAGHPAAEQPAVMYRLLSDDADRPVFAPLREAAHRHVAELAGTGRLAAAWRHLAAMAEVRYADAGTACYIIGGTLNALDPAARATLDPAWSALLLLARALAEPADAAARQAADDARAALARSGPPLLP